MDALRFTSAKKRTQEQRDAFRAWLHQNNRIARDLNGHPDVHDCTVTDSGGIDTDVSLDIVRDTGNNRVHYAAIAETKPTTFERRFVQLDREPTPFPESLSEWLVTV